MIVYADTHTCVYLVQGDVRKIGNRAKALIEAADVRISPIVMLELEYLFETGRVAFDSDGALSKLAADVGVTVCDLPFPSVVKAATGETWTRDVFDRIVVAQAKANGLAPLLSADRLIQKHYKRAVW